MILSKNDYKKFILEDQKHHEIDKWKFHYKWKHPTLYFQRVLRKTEYYSNCQKGFLRKIVVSYFKFKLKRIGIKLGITIPINTFKEGLRIVHYGSIVVSSGTKVGKNCRIHSDVNIGVSKGKHPLIGDNVLIGPGAKIFGGITIGNNVVIGANSVVNKNVPDNAIVAGVPARIISINENITGEVNSF